MTTAVALATTFTEVLIATDFGQESDRGLAYARSVVRASEGELLLVHVAEPEPHIGIPEDGWVGGRVQDCRRRGPPRFLLSSGRS